MSEERARIGGEFYTREDLKKFDEVTLRGALHERTHHGIEVPIYPTILNWSGKAIPNFGIDAKILFEEWQARGYGEEDEDIVWVKRYLEYAEQIRNGIKPEIPEVDELPEAFTDEELKVVNKLLWGRKSGRSGWSDKYVSDELIDAICDAGRAAPIGCNLDEVRFIVLRTEEEKKLIWSDVSTENAVIIVIAYDKRPSRIVKQDLPERVPHNRGFDCAAAGDHMGLMAHALGLTSVWLSDSPGHAKEFKEAYGLPEEFEVAMHLAVGYAKAGSIKSGRVPLKYMYYSRDDK
ncbi:MAG: nitroreductase family protein [Lachnospiraceae bacterium]|nr:nitroreductase family protein [Lachnospiraceae bacterium]